jgi:hypothetical protein
MNMTQKKQAAGFDDWVDMWEKAQSDGTFANAPKPPAQGGQGSFFGMQYSGRDADMPPEDADTEYWNQVYQRSNHAGDSPDIAAPEVLQEQKKPVEKQKKPIGKKPSHRPLPETRPLKEENNNNEFGKIAKAQSRSPNPIYYYSAGKDQEPHVTQNWAMGGKELTELENMKVKLHQLENKLATMIGEGKPDRQVQKLESELRKLRDRLDELSDSLHGGRVDEPKD